ncbi:hypothetical protein [Actinoplanes couchii]|uniref:HEAT repeat domain-containing protein n=1 Tax=Actinoplanes couchii TaxID=403638 RepID=A0ABQ3X087_9ACTN|nr:hypothetical protein [Actinoplanes couchii]MDR6316314.1 hypothetical protein [Actinoplanes couchii]GID51927.1 hypothetical protein Aco03nite_003310 [Actinoplanes couchii]
MVENWESAGTLFGALQRGLGRGAIRVAAGEAGAGPEVFRCLRWDQRWDTQVDDRRVYLARLVRDLGIPVAELFALLREPSEVDTFQNLCGVLSVLGQGGDQEVLAGARRYVADGQRWADMLETIADGWSRESGDDLLPLARARIEADEAAEAGGSGDDGPVIVWDAPPWRDWAVGDDFIAARMPPSPGRGRERPLELIPVAELLAELGGDRRSRWVPALAELNARGPRPELVPMLDRLAGAGSGPGPMRAMLSRAVQLLGAAAVPVARGWAADPGHPFGWRVIDVLAAHGGPEDVPVLLAEWERLAGAQALCGFDDLAAGLARIGGPEVARIVPWLHELWTTPHSYERAAYLRALLVLDPAGCGELLVEGLWDCEAEVRRIAAEHVADAEPGVRERLESLRDDPVEEDEVRAAAGERFPAPGRSAGSGPEGRPGAR